MRECTGEPVDFPLMRVVQGYFRDARLADFIFRET